LQLLLELLEAAADAFKHFAGFLTHVGELPVREPRQIGNEHLAVITEGEEGGPNAATTWVAIAGANRPIGRNGTC
jgi:hypothetical protein